MDFEPPKTSGAEPAHGTARLVVTALAIGVIVIMLGIVTLVVLVNQSNAVDALRHSSARSECRTKITNDATDAFRFDVAGILQAYGARDQAKVDAIVDKMVKEPHVQALIDATCPAPLVAVSSTTRRR